jgi:hypothetical protein
VQLHIKLVSETGFFRKYFAVTGRLDQKPGFFGRFLVIGRERYPNQAENTRKQEKQNGIYL